MNALDHMLENVRSTIALAETMDMSDAAGCVTMSSLRAEEAHLLEMQKMQAEHDEMSQRVKQELAQGGRRTNGRIV